MPISEARKKANEKYIKAQDEIKVRVPGGQKSVIQSHAQQQGESLNGFVNRAIVETMEQDGKKTEGEAND